MNPSIDMSGTLVRCIMQQCNVPPTCKYVLLNVEWAKSKTAKGHGADRIKQCAEVLAAVTEIHHNETKGT